MSIFQAYAEVYDLFRDEEELKKDAATVLELAASPRTILDIGCGTATHWKYYPPSVVKLSGVERSPEMIARSEFKNKITCRDLTDLRCYKQMLYVDVVTALFNVMNYVSNFFWWQYLPVTMGQYLVFDVWDYDKIQKEGFSQTVKRAGAWRRTITPLSVKSDRAVLTLDFFNEDTGKSFSETHVMYLYTAEDFFAACKKRFTVVKIKDTDRWKTWYAFRRIT